MKLVTGDFNKCVVQWNDYTLASETVKVMKSVSKVVVV